MEALEKKLGISKDGETGQNKKRRLDDDEYIEQSKEIVDNVKSAVSAGTVPFDYSPSTYLAKPVLRSSAEEEEESQSQPRPSQVLRRCHLFIRIH